MTTKLQATRLYEDGGGNLYVVTQDRIYCIPETCDSTYAADVADQGWMDDDPNGCVLTDGLGAIITNPQLWIDKIIYDDNGMRRSCDPIVLIARSRSESGNVSLMSTPGLAGARYLGIREEAIDN